MKLFSFAPYLLICTHVYSFHTTITTTRHTSPPSTWHTSSDSSRRSMSKKSMSMDIIPRIPPVIQSGVVLVSQPGEHNHYLYQQTVFLYEYNVRGSRGVILERPTAFNMGEMSPGMLGDVFEGNTLYTGGDQGENMAIMLHPYNYTGYVKSAGMGVFIGGIRQAREAIAERKASPKDFKFFFNDLQWSPGILEKEVESGRWAVVEVPVDLVLRQGSVTNLWARAREAISRVTRDGAQEDGSEVK